MLYIYFSKDKKSTRTEEMGEDILVDYSGKEMIGIEILDASKKLPKQDLDWEEFEMSRSKRATRNEKIYPIHN